MAQRYPTAAECIAADPFPSLDCYRLIFYLKRSDGYLGMNMNVYYIYLNKDTSIDAFAYPLGSNSGLPGVAPNSEYILKYDSTNNIYYYPSYEKPTEITDGVLFMNWGTYDEEFTAGPGHTSSIYWSSVLTYTDYYYTPVICYSDLIVYDSYNSPIYVPESDKDHFFIADGWTLNFGALAVQSSTIHEPVTGNMNRYYYSGRYDPVIRFTSPVDHLEYTVNPNKFTKYLAWDADYEYIFVDVPPTITGTQNAKYFELNTPVGETKYILGIRNLEGPGWVADNLTSYGWDDMTDHRSFQSFTLSDIVNYFKATNPLFSSEDVFTEIFMDFVVPSSGVVWDTLSVDFSSLQGSGVDVTTSTGTPEPGTSWNPMPSLDKEGQTDPNFNGEESTGDSLNHPLASPYGKFHKTWLLNSSKVETLADILTTTDSSAIEAILDGLQMWGSDPMNAIVDLRMYPFNVAAATGSSTVDNIILGNYDTHLEAIKMADAPICSIYLGGITVPSYYNNFLDYEPYTTIRLFIPYVGTVDLPPSLFVNHICSVNLVVDFYTGACTAYIYRDKYIMMQLEGIIGTSIALSGNNASDYANGIIGNIVGTIGSAAGAIAGGISGNPKLAVTEGLNAVNGVMNTIDSFNDVQFQLAGSTSPAIATWEPLYCRLLIARPQLVYTSQNAMRLYGTNIGYATNYTTTIGSLSATGIYYGVVSDHIGAYASEPTPTAREIDLIKQRLNDGFFVGVRPS